MNTPRVSIVIVNFETPDYTLQCLQSLFQHPPKTAFETIVLDNGSSDQSLETIRQNFPNVFCIETGQNVGYSVANNLGINNARGEYVLLLNSDTKILPDALDRLIESLDNHPAAAIVGPRQMDGQGKLQLSWGRFPTLASEFLRKLAHWRLSINDWRLRDYLEEKSAESPEVDWVSGSCWIARKKVLLEAGLFDPRFFMYFEDLDLCRRVQKMGWSIRYAAESKLIHYGGISAQRNILRILVEYRRSQIHFTRKYYGLRGVVALKALLFFKSSMNLLRWGIVYCRDRIMRGAHDTSYTRLLLSKKTLELSVGLDNAA